MTLDQLLPGQRGLIERLDGPPALVQRLLEFGLLEGEEVEVLAFAPLGDPIEVQSSFTRLSLRRSEAAHIFVNARS
jgi:ferrous iron transport protein A